MSRCLIGGTPQKLCWWDMSLYKLALPDSFWKSLLIRHKSQNHSCWFLWEKLNRGVSKPGCFPLFSGKVQIVSRTLSGLFLVGALNRPRKRKRTIGKIPGPSPSKSGKSQKNRESPKKDKKGQKRTKKEGQVQIGKPPRLKHPRLAALDDFCSLKSLRLRDFASWASKSCRCDTSTFLLSGPNTVRPNGIPDRAPSSTPTPKTPQTQAMVWVFPPQKLRPWSEFLLSLVNKESGVVWVLVRVFLGPWSELPPARSKTLG